MVGLNAKMHGARADRSSQLRERKKRNFIYEAASRLLASVFKEIGRIDAQPLHALGNFRPFFH